MEGPSGQISNRILRRKCHSLLSSNLPNESLGDPVDLVLETQGDPSYEKNRVARVGYEVRSLLTFLICHYPLPPEQWVRDGTHSSVRRHVDEWGTGKTTMSVWLPRDNKEVEVVSGSFSPDDTPSPSGLLTLWVGSRFYVMLLTGTQTPIIIDSVHRRTTVLQEGSLVSLHPY